MKGGALSSSPGLVTKDQGWGSLGWSPEPPKQLDILATEKSAAKKSVTVSVPLEEYELEALESAKREDSGMGITGLKNKSLSGDRLSKTAFVGTCVTPLYEPCML